MRNDKPADAGSVNLVEEVHMVEESWSEDESPEIPQPANRSSSAAGAASSARGSVAEPEEEVKDFWRTCANRVIRVHMKPRKRMFCPNDAEECPVLLEHLENRRTTERTDPDGDTVIESEDCWRASSKARFEQRQAWQGHTTFYVRPEAGPGYEWYSLELQSQ